MNDLETRIRTEFHGREGDAPAFDLADARQIAGRTRRRQILNATSAGVGALAVVIALTSGLGGLLRADRVPADQRPPSPAGTAGIALPIGYPVGEELPDLGDAPGPLAAIWVDRGDAGAPEVVGLVAETGAFGTLPIDLSHDELPDDIGIPLSADGRRIAYMSPRGELVVRDLVSGEDHLPMSEFRTRHWDFTWFDATHLVGHVAGGSDADAWVWEPGTAPELVDYYAFAEGFDLWVASNGGGPQGCVSPALVDRTGEYGDFTPGWGYTVEVPVLCDLLGVIGSETLLGHWNDPNDGNGTVVALDIHGADVAFEDPSLRRVVASAGAPDRVAFATDLIGEALDTPPPSPSQAQGFSTFSSALHEVTIGYPAGWKVRPATEPWRFGRLTFDASDVDVIFDPTRGDDLYLALASKPLGSLSREEWLDDSWRPGVCAKTAGAGSGGISFGGARRYWTVSCSGGGSSSASGHYLRVATDTRGYLIYLHVANLRASDEPPYDVDFFNSLLETLELEYTNPNGGSS